MSRPTHQQFRDAAKAYYAADGDLEIDPGATVSVSPDGGAYVQMWKWVSDAGARVKRPAPTKRRISKR